MMGLAEETHFNGVLEFLNLLNLLANSTECEYLASLGFSPNSVRSESNRIQSAYGYIMKNFTDAGLRIQDVAACVNMSESAFSHFFKNLPSALSPSF